MLAANRVTLPKRLDVIVSEPVPRNVGVEPMPAGLGNASKYLGEAAGFTLCAGKLAKPPYADRDILSGHCVQPPKLYGCLWARQHMDQSETSAGCAPFVQAG